MYCFARKYGLKTECDATAAKKSYLLEQKDDVLNKLELVKV
jgi:hypothetical protein